MQSGISYDKLNDIAQQLKKIANDLQYIADQTSEIVNGIEKNGFWIGKSADYFQAQFKKFTSCFDEAYNQVTSYALAIENTITKYKAIEESVFRKMV